MEPNGTTKRVELSGEQWADMVIRPMTGDDLYFQAKVRSERGFTDGTLDGIVVAVPFITEWSFGSVNDRGAVLKKLMSLELADINEIVSAVGERAAPNPSAPSSGGTSSRRGPKKDRSIG